MLLYSMLGPRPPAVLRTVDSKKETNAGMSHFGKPNQSPSLKDKLVMINKTYMQLGLPEPGGGITFLDASGGTRKTLLAVLILAKIMEMLMEGGRTAHSVRKLPLDITRQENPNCQMSKARGWVQVLMTYKLIIWDRKLSQPLM
ncbi:hypothetical protein J437_LFUL005165 [Ladona fulva]|uniref:ATP-dependent DNA helicase n=1 Tax=Ladona fulva TaxID=123851 RepID=A0A8K0KML5_LADFU|nr:hypothetical protein J437_LFUL005165 [Ladona fulva]